MMKEKIKGFISQNLSSFENYKANLKEIIRNIKENKMFF